MTGNKGMAKLLKALSEFQQTVTGAKKDAKNPFFKTTYADLASVTTAIKEGTKGLNLGFYHTIDNAILTTVLFFSDGQDYAEIKSSLSVDVKINGKNPMQDMGSAITYAKRYTLQSLFGLPSEDDDGNSLDGVRLNKGKPEPQQPQEKFFTLESLELAKPKIEAKFKDNINSDAIEIAKGFKEVVIKQGFTIPANVEKAIASYCQEMAEKYNDEIPV